MSCMNLPKLSGKEASMLEQFKVNEVFRAAEQRTGEQRRCAREEGGTVFVYAHGKRKYGRRYSSESAFLAAYAPITPKRERTPTEKWHARLNRAVACLNESRLWPEILQFFRNCLQMTDEDRRAMHDVCGRESEWQGGHLIHKPADEMDRLWAPFAAKYPFAFSTDDDGHLHVDRQYFDKLAECRLKSMYFGKYLTSDVREELRCAIEDGRSFKSGLIRAGYDVSVELRAGDRKAWYSEEYRNCSNGHYYLALDHMTAVFCEDD